MDLHPVAMRIEDEGSLSSTFEADSFCVSPSDEIPSCASVDDRDSNGREVRRRRPLHVRFEASTNVIHPSPTSPEEIPLLWYSSTEYDEFRASYFKDVRECVCQDRQRRTNSKEKPSSSSSAKGDDSMETILLSVYEKCCHVDQEMEYMQSVLTNEEEIRLTMVVSREEVLVGMERSCVRKVRQGRKMRQRELQDMVRYIQNFDGSPTQEAKIRVVAQEISRPCRQMALQTASALAASLGLKTASR